jgi:hypothetical protein
VCGAAGRCPLGQHCCDGGCLDVQADSANCGACGRTCATAENEICAGGECVCGEVGVCPAGHSCCGGRCCGEGETCTATGQCEREFDAYLDGWMATWTVPEGVTRVRFDTYGGSGGGSFYHPIQAEGGRAAGTLEVTSGEIFTIMVAGNGQRGTGPGYGGAGGFPNGSAGGAGGSAGAGGGGGSSEIRRGGERVIVAGGGGGHGAARGTRGGLGGGANGGNAGGFVLWEAGGLGATPSGPGTGGYCLGAEHGIACPFGASETICEEEDCRFWEIEPGQDGSPDGRGGAPAKRGGGGGGGFYGGGGGASSSGGGGGSGFVTPEASDPVLVQGFYGNYYGRVVITYPM